MDCLDLFSSYTVDDCGAVPMLFNGIVNPSGGVTTYNSTATISCNAAWTYSSSSTTIRCQAGGSWQSLDGNCTCKLHVPIVYLQGPRIFFKHLDRRGVVVF